jgi:hypothetical protein
MVAMCRRFRSKYRAKEESMKRCYATPIFLVLSLAVLIPAGAKTARAENTAVSTVQEFTKA